MVKVLLKISNLSKCGGSDKGTEINVDEHLVRTKIQVGKLWLHNLKKQTTKRTEIIVSRNKGFHKKNKPGKKWSSLLTGW